MLKIMSHAEHFLPIHSYHQINNKSMGVSVLQLHLIPSLFSYQLVDDIFYQDTSSKNGQQIYDLACDGLHYLDTRTDFWRQQKPMYSRKREKQERLKGKQKQGNHETYVMGQLQKIDQGFS